MGNIEKGSIKHLIIVVAIYIVMGLIMYPILDWIYAKVITHSEFVYSIEADVIKPIFICLAMGICSWVMEKNSK